VSEWRTSVHESGHAAAAFLLGATVGAGPVSIVPGAAYRGICFTGRPRRFPDADWAGLARPYPLIPARLTRYYEIEVMVQLAGEITAELHAGANEPPAPADLPEAGPAGANEPPALPPREAQALEEAAACDVINSDVAKVFEILKTLHFGDEDLAHKHARFLAAETEALMAGKPSRQKVLALAAELVQYRTLAAKRWKKILEEAK
jgi:hypothetical protein